MATTFTSRPRHHPARSRQTARLATGAALVAVAAFALGIVFADGAGDVRVDVGTVPPAVPALADGRYPVMLSALDLDAGFVELDVVAWLTGDEARAAWLEQHPEDPGGPPNGYVIANDDVTIRALPLGDGVAVRILRSGPAGVEHQVATIAELRDHLADNIDPDGTWLTYSPYWIDVRGGEVVMLEEQYLP